jgi:manganese/zinc/iron transport system permease protein
MTLTPSDGWVMLTASLAAVACAVPGCFLVLRRMSMLGDAISHAVLPGIALAFLITNTREPLAMLLGAGAFGLLTAIGSRAIHRLTRLPEDASMGVVFSTLFAVGVLLISWTASRVDLDPGCVLYGLLEAVALGDDRLHWLGVGMPRQTAVLGIACVTNIVLVGVFFKELRLVCFDEPLARAVLGAGAGIVSQGILALVAATTVVSFEAVGSILVVTMLVAPGATAHLLTDRLGRMIAIAAGLGVLSAVLGHLGAIHWNSSTAGMISVVAGAQFVLAVLFAPRHGVLAKRLASLGLSLRIAAEDILGALYRRSEGRDEASTPLPTGRWAGLAMRRLIFRGLVAKDGTNRPTLTSRGVEAGRAVVRAHRLWEAYLAKHLALPSDHLHEPSHRLEHYLSPEMRQELGREVGDGPDPHGRPIPSEI